MKQSEKIHIEGVGTLDEETSEQLRDIAKAKGISIKKALSDLLKAAEDRIHAVN